MSIRVDVYHFDMEELTFVASDMVIPLTFSGRPDAAAKADALGLYKKVATVMVADEIGTQEALNVAFEKTNHIDHSWMDNADIEVAGDNSHRSSMPGDVFVMEGKAHVVKGMGFAELDSFSALAKPEPRKSRHADNDGPTP